ncbi:MAG TPA: hypothetical protein VIF62_00635 [Labilithrix sp.]|jgi:hypothetical protein
MREVCAPVPPCASWIDALREQPVPLHVFVVDRVSPGGCAIGSSSSVTVTLDDAVVGTANIPCSGELRAPPPMYRLNGPDVVAGLHEISVRAQLPSGTIDSAMLMSLPAFDITDEGRSAVLGAEIVIDVNRDDVFINAPQVYPPKGL